MSFTIQTPRGPRRIGIDEPCFIIAEMSGNHKLNFDKAVAIIKAVAAAGADAIKIQTYTPDTLTIDCDKEWFMVKGKDQPDNWQGQKLYDLYKTAYTPLEWDAPLQKIAEAEGLVFFSTPYDVAGVDLLESLNVPLYKIASYETTDVLLLRRVAQTGKPVIMSVGFASQEEVESALATLRENGAKEIAVLHCVTAYSDRPVIDEMNLKTMLDIRDRYGVVAGFSDNNGGVEVPIVAAAMGASIIEKHFIMEREEGGADARFSVQPEEFKTMVENIRRQERIKGIVKYGVQSEQEKQNTFFRRSLFVVKDIKKGELFSAENIRSIRPSSGLPTKYYDGILGKTATQDVERGTPLNWDVIEGGQN